MIHDPNLLDKLISYNAKPCTDSVFRVTTLSAYPTAPAVYGGRWSPQPTEEKSHQVLYTSMKREGAIAEVASYLKELVPMPSRPLKIHKLGVKMKKVIELSWDDLGKLGVNRSLYGERNYHLTQKIGAAINFLEIEGLIAPSARWECNNLILFTENLSIDDMPNILQTEEFDWQKEARLLKLLPSI